MPTIPGTLAGVDAELLAHAKNAELLLKGVREHRARLVEQPNTPAADLAELDRAIRDLEESIGAVRFRAHGAHGVDQAADARSAVGMPGGTSIRPPAPVVPPPSPTPPLAAPAPAQRQKHRGKPSEDGPTQLMLFSRKKGVRALLRKARKGHLS